MTYEPEHPFPGLSEKAVKVLKEQRSISQQMMANIKVNAAGGNPTEKLVTERGSKYGKPIDHFSCVTQIEKAWTKRREGGKKSLTLEQEDALAHGVHMIIDKIVRAAETPDYEDNWNDIQGYTECIKGFVCKDNNNDNDRK